MTDKEKAAIRQADLKARREAQGMVRRPYWATPKEHDEVIKPALREARKEEIAEVLNSDARDFWSIILDEYRNHGKTVCLEYIEEQILRRTGFNVGLK